MTRLPAILLLALASLLIASEAASAQAVRRDPHIGYLYPAGAQRGQTAHVLIGGQFLNGAADVLVTGEGVSAKVVAHYRPLRNLNGDQRKLLRQRMAEAASQRWEEMVEAGDVEGQAPWNWARPRRAKPEKTDDKADPDAEEPEPIKLPEHYLLNGWDDRSLRELAYIHYLLNDRSKRQRNAQLEDSVLIEVTIDASAEPGDRELRLLCRGALTNPMIFQVGQLPEVFEVENNDPDRWDPLPKEPALDLPVLVNGQIMPGDVDLIRFNAKAGQELVIETHARHLVPFLADAVPGWFQATLSIRDARGNELDFADDYHFNPDPVLLFQVPQDGEYALAIRDSIYRGREDFVYRVSIGEFPFVTSVFPLGTRAGHTARAHVTGWNLPGQILPLRAEEPGIHQAALPHRERQGNAVRYIVDDAPDVLEHEPNDTERHAQFLEGSVIVNGRISKPGDVDVYRVRGLAGQTLVARITARLLGSPLDSLVQVTDASGRVIGWNDDYMDKQGHLHRGMGTLTHHADSQLSVQLPADGIYHVHVSDAAGHGSEASAYRLYIGPPTPGFDLRICPSSITVFTGQSAAIEAHVLRHDGFDGPVTIQLKDGPEGFELDGAVIPAGESRVRMTLTAPPRRVRGPIALSFTGTADVSGETITQNAVPADDVMQAFLWRHLVPAEQTLVSMTGPRRASPAPSRTASGPVQIPRGGEAAVTFSAKLPGNLSEVQAQLDEAPKGITLDKVRYDGQTLTFAIAAEPEVPADLKGNLIINLSAKATWKQKGKTQSRRRMLGALRAVPFEVTKE